MRRFGLISLGLHIAALAGLLIWFSHAGRRELEAPDKLPTVELVLVEQQGSGPQTNSAIPAPPPEAVPAPTAEAAPPQEARPEAKAEPLPLPLPPPPPPPPAPSQASTQGPAEPARPTAPLSVSLGGGTNDETNAIALGAQIVPAGLDSRYRNREPVYPPESVRRIEQGAVDLLVHVAPNGTASAVDVMTSSGHARLDAAAREAVITWRFLPAVKDGQPIAFDMPFRVVFRLD